MTLGRWANAQSSHGEVRARSKIGRIAGRIPLVFRHGSDENGVGWSDIETPAGNASPDGIEAESGIAACPTDPSGAKKESIEEAANQGVPAQLFVEISSVQQALIAACGARVLLICDAEGAEAGQAGNLIGDSLDAQEYLGALRGGSSRRGR